MRVMIFDDEEDVLSLYSMILKRRGYDVYTSQNCIHLFDKISEAKPDIIIMDNEMPVLNGPGATKLLKENAEFSGIPIISISANIDGKKLAEEAHADMFLCKPIHIAELESAIDLVTKRAA
jgi:DNA-binding response OmpR family regulator